MAKEKVTRVFQMTPDSAMKFFEIVQELVQHGIEDSRELRMWVLNYMAQHGYVDTMYDTKRSKDQVVEDFRKRGFNVDDRTK